MLNDNIRVAEQNKSKVMDFNYIDPLTGVLISLKAKTFNDTRTNSNFFLSLFGKIIKGRHLNKKDYKYQTISIREYGFLFDINNMDRIKKLLSVIEESDWKPFCSQFDLKYVYMVGNEDYKVYYAANFIENATNDSEYFNDKTINENNEDNT